MIWKIQPKSAMIGMISMLHTKSSTLLGLNASDPSPRSMKKFLPHNAVVLDIGANEGDFAALCKKACKSVKLVVVEPQKELEEKLLAILGPDDLCIWKAASNFVGVSAFHRKSIGDRKASLLPSKNSYDMNVGVTSVDQICEEYNLKRVNLLKIDTEGNDFRVLLGSEESIDKGSIDAIIFEVSYQTFMNGFTPQEIEGWLRDKGYSRFYRATKRLGFIPVAKLHNYRAETQNILVTREPRN
jgi:FkbM family methyltransferase